jgi:hypothetical protein
VADPVQGQGFDWVARVNFFNQNDVVLVKKKTKVNGLQLGFEPSHTKFFLPLFFFNSARFQPRVSRVTNQLLDRARFQNYVISFETL